MAAEYDERYQGNGDTDTAEGGHAQAEYAAPAAAVAPAAGGSPPADSKPAGFADHADGRSSQPQVRARAPQRPPPQSDAL